MSRKNCYFISAKLVAWKKKKLRLYHTVLRATDKLFTFGKLIAQFLKCTAANFVKLLESLCVFFFSNRNLLPNIKGSNA